MLMPCKAAHAPPITLVHQIAPNLADDNNLLSDNRSGVTTSIVTECTSLNFLAVDDDAAPPEYINMQPTISGNSDMSQMMLPTASIADAPLHSHSPIIFCR